MMTNRTEFRPHLPLPSGHEVLVIEDELRIRNMLSQALHGMGFHATLAPTAEEGARLLKKQPFDILILDLNLPGMEGLDFLKSIRAHNQSIQIIILTGFGTLEAAKTAIHFDVVEFLTKPCSLENLEVALDRARKRRKALVMAELGESPEHPSTYDPSPPSPPPRAETNPSENPLGMDLEDLERRHIMLALEKHNGNRAAAAGELGISLRKLYYRLREYERRDSSSGPAQNAK
jgi:DNA-binding NtrC family response regulator